MSTDKLTEFDYLLNRMMHAGQADKPAEHGYAEHRRALYAYVRRLEALAAAPQVEGWRPIATAPRDGSVFVVARFTEDEIEPDFDYELGRYKPLIFNRYEPAGEGLFREVAEQVYDWNGFNNFGRMTHWMPLPPPPADEEVPA